MLSTASFLALILSILFIGSSVFAPYERRGDRSTELGVEHLLERQTASAEVVSFLWGSARSTSRSATLRVVAWFQRR